MEDIQAKAYVPNSLTVKYSILYYVLNNMLAIWF